jgi:hypothetical protein
VHVGSFGKLGLAIQLNELDEAVNLNNLGTDLMDK